MIANVLDWAKLKAQKLTLPNDQPFELAAIGEECKRLVKCMLREKPVLVTVVAPEEACLQGAPVHLQQTLLNLLTNACKYTDEGTIVLSMTIVNPDDGVNGSADPDLVTVRFAVEDTGVGVSPQEEALIFEEFKQGPKVGTGLGLPLSRSLVDLMGGRLMLEKPTTGRGSVFTFTCSFRKYVAPPPSPAPTWASVQLPVGLRVLVADDQSINRLLVTRLLGMALPEPLITQVATSEEALKHLFEEEFAIVTLDEHFGADPLLGTEITRQYRTHEQSQLALAAGGAPRLVTPVVIIGITGMKDESFDSKAKAMGQDCVWGKPLPSPKQIREQLLELLAARM